MLLTAAARRPQRLELAQDPFPELVAGPRQRERDVGVQALQPAGAGPGARDAEL
jgi:hypothetical protein